MIGTITNTLAILAGTAIGGTLRRGIKPQYQEVMFDAIGLASLALGFNAVCRHMPQSHYPVLFVLSLVVGGLVGRMLNLDGRMKRLTRPAAGQHDTEPAKYPLAQGLTTAILLFCIGTLSIVGPINSALLGDHTYLFTNAMLDFATSAILSATYGYGIALAAPVLFCWQGSIYLLARLCGNIIPDELLCELSIVGGTLIAASGLGILHIKDCRTLDLLPALLVPVIYFVIKGLV